jgi:type VI secretion system protein ImpA
MPLRDDLLTPIPGDNPAGTHLRYELYDIVREARREEIDAPTGGWDRPRKTADWALVAKETSNALATKSKDLQLAVWLIEASYHRESFAGFSAAVRVTAQMLATFWDHLYPELEDGDAEARIAPLAWLGSDKQPLRQAIRLAPITTTGLTIFKFRDSQDVGYESESDDYDKKQARKKKIESGKMSGEEFDQAFNATPKAWYKQLAADLVGALDALAALDRVGNEKFGPDAPGYSELRKPIEEVQGIVRELLAKKLALEPDPIEAAPAVEATTEALGTESAATVAAGGALTAEPTSRDDATQRVVVAARWLRRAEPTSPTSYMMLRALRWGELRAQAPDPDPRLLAAPAPASRTQLRSLMLDAKWAELLDAAETVMATPAGRGWLDVQRYALKATDELGPEYAAVGSAIRSELRALLREVPSLVDLTMMDGLPTASPDTRNWLRVEFAGAEPDEVTIAAEADGGASGPVAVAGGADGRDRGYDRGYDRALGEVRAGRPQKAIEMLLRELDREKSPRGRFLRQAQLTRIMVEAGFEAIARPILDEMLQRMETHRLEEWEAGPLLAQPLSALYQCLAKTGEDASRQQQVYLRICRLDPVQAMSFGPKS